MAKSSSLYLKFHNFSIILFYFCIIKIWNLLILYKGRSPLQEHEDHMAECKHSAADTVFIGVSIMQHFFK